MAWNIVRHAFVIVFGNFGNALRASIVPFAILVGLMLGLSILTGLPLSGQSAAIENLENPGMVFVFVLIGAAATMFVFAWVAVTWHRFILLEEYPTIVPTITDRPIGAYVARTLMIVLQMMCIMIPLMLILLPLFGALLLNPVLGLGLTVVLNVLLTFLWFRVCVSLPSVAVGETMSSKEAWAKTSDAAAEIFVMSVIIIVLTFGASTIVAVLFSGIPVISSILTLAVQWISMMVGISLLTTVYGHVVEGRPLTGS